MRSSAEMAHTCLSVTEIHLSHLPRSDGDAMSADDWCCKRCHQSPGLQHGENCDPPRFAPPAARRAPLFPPDKPLPGLQHYLTASSGFREADDQSASWPTSPRSAALGKSTCLHALHMVNSQWTDYDQRHTKLGELSCYAAGTIFDLCPVTAKFPNRAPQLLRGQGGR